MCIGKREEFLAEGHLERYDLIPMICAYQKGLLGPEYRRWKPFRCEIY
jgi:hypothetical protein